MILGDVLGTPKLMHVILADFFLDWIELDVAVNSISLLCAVVTCTQILHLHLAKNMARVRIVQIMPGVFSQLRQGKFSWNCV